MELESEGIRFGLWEGNGTVREGRDCAFYRKRKRWESVETRDKYRELSRGPSISNFQKNFFSGFTQRNTNGLWTLSLATPFRIKTLVM